MAAFAWIISFEAVCKFSSLCLCLRLTQKTYLGFGSESKRASMGRAPCCDKANVKRGPWSPEEDATLKSYVESHGTGGNWIALPRKAGLSLSLSVTLFIFLIFIEIVLLKERK